MQLTGSRDSTDAHQPTASPKTTAPPVGMVTFTKFPIDSVTAITTGTSTYSKGGHLSGGIPMLDPHCWFCPPGPPHLVGWAIPGFKNPGVYPGGWPPPGFTTPFPLITIGPGGDPIYSSDPPKSEPSKSGRSESQSSISQTSCSTTSVPKYTLDISVFVPKGAATSTTTTKVSTLPLLIHSI
jgi:hypothetical protein